MRTPDRLPDEALDSLLDGSPSQEALGTPLAAYLDAVRHDAVSTDPQPSDELGVVLAEGLDPAELEERGILTATAGGAATSWRRRGRMALRALVTKFAALGILTKAAATGAAVTVAASGAGAAGVLPPPAQSTFNEVIGREAPPEDAGAENGDAETGASTPETPADTSSTAPLDSDLSDDATGTSDGEPGVDGREVASDASDGRSDVSEVPDRTPASEAPVAPPADAPDGTPAEDTVGDTPGADAPPASDAGDGSGQDAADNGDVEQRPEGMTQSPQETEQRPRG